MWNSRSVRMTVSERRSRRRPKAAAISPHAVSAKNATTSLSWVMERVRYGSVRKKFRLRAEISAVTSAGPRPAISATTIVKARKANARLAAVTVLRSEISAMPSARAPRAPITVHTIVWSLRPMATSWCARRDTARRSREQPGRPEDERVPAQGHVELRDGSEAAQPARPSRPVG